MSILLAPVIPNNLFDFPSFAINFNIPRPNTEKFKHSFQYSGARLWNDLPANIRNSNSLYSFKNSMLKHIKSKRDTH